MPGRMESVENLSRQQYLVRGAVDGFPPFPPPLGNRYAIPTVPQPRRRRYLSYEQETQGDTSIELPRGTFLLGVDNWKQHELPNVCPKDYGELNERARKALRRMHRKPRLITAFWKQSSLCFE